MIVTLAIVVHAGQSRADMERSRRIRRCVNSPRVLEAAPPLLRAEASHAPSSRTDCTATASYCICSAAGLSDGIHSNSSMKLLSVIETHMMRGRRLQAARVTILWRPSRAYLNQSTFLYGINSSVWAQAGYTHQGVPGDQLRKLSLPCPQPARM
jgi:hypothetical protein